MPTKKETKKADPLLGADNSEQEEEQKSVNLKGEVLSSGTEAKAKEPQAKTPGQAKTDLKDTVAQTKAILATKPHVNFIIPKTDTEPANAVETVQINGYRLTIQKGVMVNIPLPVANILAEKYRINMEAGQKNRIDRDAEHQEALS